MISTGKSINAAVSYLESNGYEVDLGTSLVSDYIRRNKLERASRILREWNNKMRMLCGRTR